MATGRPEVVSSTLTARGTSEPREAARVLALLGIYGVMARGASRRVGEMAVRQVLGARLADLVRLLVGEGIG